MALDGGGGGGGGPVGFANSFTGPAEALEIIGDHAYGFTGVISGNTSPKTGFDFVSGNYYFVGTFQYNAPTDDDNPSLSNSGTANIRFNGTSIALLKAGDDDANKTAQSVTMDIIIPPYTEVTVILDSNDTQADRYFSASFTGRIYRTQ